MAAKGNTKSLLALAQQFLGTPYVWGGSTPKTGFDCSGFVQWLYGQQGVKLPRTTYDQVASGRPVAKQSLKPGDILFFEPTKNGPGHEGLYIGNGKFIEAPHTGANVRISSLSSRGDFVTARRVLTPGAPDLATAVKTLSEGGAQPQAAADPSLPSLSAPAGSPPPTALATPSPDVELPGSVNYTMSPHHETYGLWQQVAGDTQVSSDTMNMLRNAQLSAGG